MAEVSPVPFEVQLFSNNGAPLSGGQIFTYSVGTLTPLVTYQDINGLIPNENPIIADAAGRFFCWAPGDVRVIVQDSNSVLIADYNTTAPLRSDVISAAMLPVVGASTLALARTAMGIDTALQNAINAVDLLPGPTGPVGPQGIQGNTGSSGAASNYAPQLNGSNPGFLQLPNVNGSLNFFFQFGQAATSGGSTNVSFPTTYPNVCLGVQLTSINGNPATGGADVSMSLIGVNSGGFACASSSLTFPGGGFGGNVTFFWQAVGF